MLASLAQIHQQKRLGGQTAQVCMMCLQLCGARFLVAAAAEPSAKVNELANRCGEILAEFIQRRIRAGSAKAAEGFPLSRSPASWMPTPQPQQNRGADITLKFTPNKSVNAMLIGLSQSVQSFVAGALAPTPAAATRMIPAAEAKPINTGPGETDEGTAIDRASGYNNPIYPVRSAASTSLDDPNTSPGWGQLGWYYLLPTGTPVHREAMLIDAARRPGAAKDSRQVFEVTALATRGVDAGTYYGSVRWGWRTDAAGTLTKIDLQKVSDGVPSSTFLKAAGIWDKGKSSTGTANVKFSAPQIMVTKAPVVLSPHAFLLPPITLPIGTRVQIIGGLVPPSDTGTLQVVDGPHAGAIGDIHGPAALSWMSALQPERP